MNANKNSIKLQALKAMNNPIKTVSIIRIYKSKPKYS